LSIAGVPPFLGFFSKLFILLILINSNFFIFYIWFFGLLLFGLYFYAQNLRFLYSTGPASLNYAFERTVRVSTFFIFFAVVIAFVIISGGLFINDFFLYFYWLFS
jgi:NADH:ubiquinone oxidoreductase subunit 2 (subunit N)